jgi:putative flippase GtrA
MGSRVDPIWVRRAGRFGIAGLLVTGLHSIIAAGLIETILPRPALANGIAFVTATACSYLLNTYWSFSRTPAPANLLRFLGVSLLGLAVAMSVAGLAAANGLPYWAGIICVVITVPPITFLLHNYWTYR